MFSSALSHHWIPAYRGTDPSLFMPVAKQIVLPSCAEQLVLLDVLIRHIRSAHLAPTACSVYTAENTKSPRGLLPWQKICSWSQEKPSKGLCNSLSWARRFRIQIHCSSYFHSFIHSFSHSFCRVLAGLVVHWSSHSFTTSLIYNWKLIEAGFVPRAVSWRRSGRLTFVVSSTGSKSITPSLTKYVDSDTFNHRPWVIRFYGFLSAAVLSALFIGILELVTHKLPQGNQPYNPTQQLTGDKQAFVKYEYLGKRDPFPLGSSFIGNTSTVTNTSSAATTPSPSCNSTLTPDCFSYCWELGVGFSVDCPTFCTRARIQIHPAGSCADPPAFPECGYNSTISPPCGRFCSSLNITSPTDCAEACNITGTTAHNPATCPPAPRRRVVSLWISVRLAGTLVA